VLIRAKAPLRISFAGGGTDVPPFPELEGGCVLSATITQFASGTLRPRNDNNIRVHSLDYGVSVTYSPEDKLVYDGKLDLVKGAILKMGCNDLGGYELFLHTNAPPGSGLGSSSAMMVALVGLLKEFKGLPLTDYEVADLAHTIERKELGIQGGLQDQYAATFGGFNFIEFLADRVVVNPLKVAPDVINELEYNLLLCYTGTMRLSASILNDQITRYEHREEDTLRALREMKDLTVAMKSALLRRHLDEFGRLLGEEWEYKKRVSDKISNASLDELYRAACKEGALGGKITGAGGGGFMLLYCDYERKHRVAEKMSEMGCSILDLRIEPLGLQTWRVASA
jgi:D-glycero-alpha-D-manno-heptose-7-phosphate kinase